MHGVGGNQSLSIHAPHSPSPRPSTPARDQDAPGPTGPHPQPPRPDANPGAALAQPDLHAGQRADVKPIATTIRSSRRCSGPSHWLPWVAVRAVYPHQLLRAARDHGLGDDVLGAVPRRPCLPLGRATAGQGDDQPQAEDDERRDPYSAHRHRCASGGCLPLCVPAAYQVNCTFTAWHPETGGANQSESERKWPGSFLWYATTRVTDFAGSPQEVGGVLYVGSASYACSIAPQR